MSRIVQAILEAQPGLRVGQIVDRRVLAVLPANLRAKFSSLTITWRKDRQIWGLSFDLDESTVQVGHFRGHHVATHPELLGISLDVARTVLLREVEGVLLHELGHAIYAVLQQREKSLAARWAAALGSEGWASEYGAGDAAEGAAEAFRWWVIDPEMYSGAAPKQHLLIVEELSAAESSLG